MKRVAKNPNITYLGLRGDCLVLWASTRTRGKAFGQRVKTLGQKLQTVFQAPILNYGLVHLILGSKWTHLGAKHTIMQTLKKVKAIESIPKSFQVL